MKKSFENLSRAERYEAPALEIIELNTENVICQASMTPADWQKGEEDLFEW